MKIPGILKQEGEYTRIQYILAQYISIIICFVLWMLVFIHIAFIALAILGTLIAFQVDRCATIKRLNDLGRPAKDYYLTFIPIVSWFVDMALWYKSGESEANEAASREYMIQQYEMKHRKRERPHGTKKNIPRRYDDFRLY